MTMFAALFYLVGLLTGSSPADSLVGTGAVVAVLLIAVVTAAVLTAALLPGPHSRGPGLAVRARAAGARVPRLRDPDAKGRTRPRGPTGRPAAGFA